MLHLCKLNCTEPGPAFLHITEKKHSMLEQLLWECENVKNSKISSVLLELAF